MQQMPYNTYSQYIKKTYGERVQKLPIDAGFTCPNRDGTVAIGGCTYCNNESFSPQTARDTIDEQIAKALENHKRKNPKLSKFFIYFQSYSNTYAPLKELEKLYLKALSYPGVIGLNIGTRSDCVDEEKIKFLEELAKDYEITIEYGLESTNDETLKRINRGHDIKNYLRAIDMTAGRGIKMASHLILGFPWENTDQMIDSAQFFNRLPIDFLKIHQLQVMKGTLLAADYLKKPFKLFTVEEYLEIISEFLIRLNPDIIVERVFGSGMRDLVIAPNWNRLSISELNAKLADLMIERNLFQGKEFVYYH